MEICHKVTKLSTKLEVEHPQSQKHGGAALQTERWSAHFVDMQGSFQSDRNQLFIMTGDPIQMKT